MARDRRGAKAGVATLQIAGAVVLHPVPQRQILRPCRRPNRVGLHEPEGVERLRQRCGWKETPGNRVSAQIVEGQSPPLPLNWSASSAKSTLRLVNDP